MNVPFAVRTLNFSEQGSPSGTHWERDGNIRVSRAALKTPGAPRTHPFSRNACFSFVAAASPSPHAASAFLYLPATMSTHTRIPRSISLAKFHSTCFWKGYPTYCCATLQNRVCSLVHLYIREVWPCLHSGGQFNSFRGRGVLFPLGKLTIAEYWYPRFAEPSMSL